MKKRILSALLALTMSMTAFAAVPVTASAAEIKPDAPVFANTVGTTTAAPQPITTTTTTNDPQIKGNSIYFNKNAEIVWTFTNDMYSDNYEGENYVFTPQKNGNYFVVVSGMADEGVKTGYNVRNDNGKVSIEKTGEYQYKRDDEHPEQVKSYKAKIFSAANDIISADYYFWHVNSIEIPEELPLVSLVINSTAPESTVTTPSKVSFTCDKLNTAKNSETPLYTYALTRYYFPYSDEMSMPDDNYYPDCTVEFILNENTNHTVYSIDYKNNDLVPDSLKISDHVIGDANCDGILNMSDAVLIMQSIANPAKYGVKGSDNSHITEQGMKNADITGNNDGVTNADALAVQKKLLNINDDDNATVIYLPITPVEGYMGTYPVTSHVVTTTTTTAPLSEQERKLAELEKKERSQGRMPRERQIILGNLPADAPRLSYEEAKQIADNSASRNELAAEIRKRYPYPDNLGMETDNEYYWLDDEGKELILLSEYFWTNVYYCNSEKNIFKPIMSIAEQKMMKEIKAEEEKLGVYLVRERQKAAGQIHPKRQHLSLEKIKGFAADSKDFAEFWKKLDFADYPDTWDGNGKPVLTYELEADNGCVIVSLSGAYAEYVNGDKSESIIKDKGTLTAETIEKKLVTLRDIVEMTE